MAHLWSDAFDLYASTSEAAAYYDSLSGTFVDSFVPVGSGVCLDTATLTKTWGSNDTTLYFSVFGIIGNSTSSNMALVFYDGSNAQCSVIFAGDSSITVRSGDTGGTILASRSADALRGSSISGAWGPWFSVQIKVVIDVLGSVDVRLNGTPSSLISISGVNTQAGSANSYATRFTLGGTSWTRFTYGWLNNGSGADPISWPGEPRAFRQLLASDNQTDFTPIPSSPNYAQVNELVHDDDTSYVKSRVVGDEDLYDMASVSGLQSILGVKYSVWAKKDDAGTRTASVRLIANGSSDTSIVSFAPSSDYVLYAGFEPTDPTSASWTMTTLNSALIGIKVDS